MVLTNRRRPLLETPSKMFFKGTRSGTLIQHFKDNMPYPLLRGNASAQKSGGETGMIASRETALSTDDVDDTPPVPVTRVVTGKGVLCNRISEYLMMKLQHIGMPTHFVHRLNMREQLIFQTEQLPVFLTIRNLAAGSLARRFGIAEGERLTRPIFEMRVDDPAVNYPLVTEEHIAAFSIANPWEIDDMVNMSLRINDYLSGLFLGFGIQLVDIRLRFGRMYDKDEVRILLTDEITPDTCRLWDYKTGAKLDSELQGSSAEDSQSLESAYQEVARRLGLLNENDANAACYDINDESDDADVSSLNKKADIFRFRRSPIHNNTGRNS